MKKSYKNPKVTVKPLNFVIVGLVVAIFVAVILLLQPNDQEKIYKSYKTAGTTNLVEDHVFKTINAKDLIKLIDSGKPVVFYFGYTGCGACVAEVGYYDVEFKAAGLESALKNIYYLNTSKMSQANITKLETKYSIELKSTPQLMYFNDGAKVTSRQDNTTGQVPAQIRAFFRNIDLTEE